jgi:hypothetical protein
MSFMGPDEIEAAYNRDPDLQDVMEKLFFEGTVEFDAGEPVKEPVMVYRLEMENGHGPYNSGLPNAREIYMQLSQPVPGFNCVKNAILNRENINTSFVEFYQTHGHVNFACDSLEAVTHWFPDKARKYLKQYGGRIVEYQIPVGGYLLKVGQGEVVFNRHESNRGREFDVVTLK